MFIGARILGAEGAGRDWAGEPGAGWGCGLAPAAAKRKPGIGYRNQAYSSRTLEAFSIQRPLRVGGVRRPASCIRCPVFVKQLHGRPMPQPAPGSPAQSRPAPSAPSILTLVKNIAFILLC